MFNQIGIGVASDTLMTSGGNSSRKTTPSSNKTYEVGGDHKVVVLHSGITALGLVRFELLIGEWASSLVSPLPTLADYADSFARFVPSFTAIRFDEQLILH